MRPLPDVPVTGRGGPVTFEWRIQNRGAVGRALKVQGHSLHDDVQCVVGDEGPETAMLRRLGDQFQRPGLEGSLGSHAVVYSRCEPGLPGFASSSVRSVRSDIMIPPQLELRARELVREAIELGGELWQYVSPATIELMVEAVAVDLREREEQADPAAAVHPDPSIKPAV